MNLVPQTTVAVRLSNYRSWRLEALPCTPDEVEAVLAKGEHVEEFRVVSFCQINPLDAARPDFRAAHCRGWLWDEPASRWRPQEEPITPPPGTPSLGRLDVVLSRVRFGWISRDIRSPDGTLEVVFDDVRDSFVPVVRFVLLLTVGEYPHFGALGEDDPAALATFPAREPGFCRLVAGRLSQGSLQPDLDVLVDRQALIGEFRTFLAALADHPCFGPMWLWHAELPSEPYDTISDEADQLWERVQDGRWEDDWDAGEDFRATYVSKRVPLSPEAAAFIDQYRRMLRTLSIPPTWA